MRSTYYAIPLVSLVMVGLVACATPDASPPTGATKDTLPNEFAGALVDGFGTRLKTAAQVESEYLKVHKSVPDHSAVVTYVTSTKPSKSIATGQTLHVTSEIVVVPGKDQRSFEIKEGIILSDSSGAAKQRAIKQVNTDRAAGEFQMDFAISFPQNVPRGRYTFKTYLYFDMELVGSNTGTFEVI